MPDRRPRAVILALHGFNDYSRAFERPGEYWTKKRIATYAYDQRGFGEAPHRGIWAGHKTMAADAAAALDLVRTRHPGVPVYVLGESMGGAIAMIAAPALQADGLVLVAPALRGRRRLGFLASAALWLTARTIPWYPLTAEGLNVQASDNVGMLRALGRDPLIIKRTRIDAVEGLVNAMDAALAAAPRLPSLVLFGARDELVPPEPALALFRRARARVVLYRDGWHMLLRDLNAQVALDDIAAWIADSAGPLPSGSDAPSPPSLRSKSAAARGRRRFGPGSFAMSPVAPERARRLPRRAGRPRFKASVRRRHPRDGEPPALRESVRETPLSVRGKELPCVPQGGLFREVRLSPTATARNADGRSSAEPCFERARSERRTREARGPRFVAQRNAGAPRRNSQKRFCPPRSKGLSGLSANGRPTRNPRQCRARFPGMAARTTGSNRKRRLRRAFQKIPGGSNKLRIDADSAASPTAEGRGRRFWRKFSRSGENTTTFRCRRNERLFRQEQRLRTHGDCVLYACMHRKTKRRSDERSEAATAKAQGDRLTDDRKRKSGKRSPALSQCRTNVDSRLRSTTDGDDFRRRSGCGPKSRTPVPFRFSSRNCPSARGTDERRFGFARPFAADASLLCRKKFPIKIRNAR